MTTLNFRLSASSFLMDGGIMCSNCCPFHISLALLRIGAMRWRTNWRVVVAKYPDAKRNWRVGKGDMCPMSLS
jgi:hypothetical protein